MPHYDFGVLSSYEFELLVRDLLQAEWGTNIEAFTPGPDSGIDLRSSRNGSTTLIQCKHFVGSGYAKLVRTLKKEERPKVKNLQPDYYYLATSVGLTPAHKNEIGEILAPWMKDSSAVLGKQDLNNLLGKPPNVHRSHLKLWLSDVEILKAVLHQEIGNATHRRLERAERQLPIYVHTHLFDLAMNALREHRVCLILGPPGVGKSTLADLLLRASVIDGFEPVVISNWIAEADRLYEGERNQVFLYDDFLGRIDYAQGFIKNEADQLVRFIEDIQHSPTKRLILVSREYVLRQASTETDLIESWRTPIAPFKISISELSEIERAKILFNHLYFGNLNDQAKQSVLQDSFYLDIVNHRNFNPRLIEEVIKQSTSDHIGISGLREHFRTALDNPGTIWQHTFGKGLNDYGQSLLLLLATFPEPVSVLQLEEAFVAYWTDPQGNEPSTVTFNEALDILEGTFLRIEKTHQGSEVDFQNPSVQGFVTHELDSLKNEITRILRCAKSFQQCQFLWQLSRAKSPNEQDSAEVHYPGLASVVKQRRELMWGALNRTFWEIDSDRKEKLGYYAEMFARPVFEERLALMIDVNTELFGLEPRSDLWFRLDEVATRWSYTGDPDGCLRLLRALKVAGPSFRPFLDQIIASAGFRRLFSESAWPTVTQFGRLIEIDELVPEALTPRDRRVLPALIKRATRADVHMTLTQHGDARGIWRQIDEWNEVATHFGADVSEVLAPLVKMAEELGEQNRDEEYNEGYFRYQIEKEEPNDDLRTREEIRAMFARLHAE